MVRFLNQYEILIQKANADLSAAEILFERFNEGNTQLDLEVVCFHLQQGAEKLLKAVLSYKMIHYPKVHDLETLLNIADDNGIELNINRDNLIELSDYAVEGRYSVMHDDLENIRNIFSDIAILMKLVHTIITDNLKS